MEQVDTLVVDKTGTLTEGRPKVVAVIPTHGLDENEVLRIAAAASRAPANIRWHGRSSRRRPQRNIHCPTFEASTRRPGRA